MTHQAQDKMSALCLSPSGKHAIVAGRDMLRLVDLAAAAAGSSTQPLEDAHNVLANTRRQNNSMNLHSNDVQWRPQHNSQVATGAATGDVLLWDTEKRGDAILRKLGGATSRAVNRLCFSPEQPNHLLIAAHERTVRLWDVGQRLATQQLTFATTKEVRDVQFCPHAPTRFAVALENGMVQLFDVRSNRGHIVQLQAHDGPAYCVEWHPEERGLLATGGRDKLIKTWELDAALPVQGGRPQNSGGLAAVSGSVGTTHVHSVLTLAAVARIKWRPGGGPEQRWQITSCAGAHDYMPHVWDVKRPAIALYSLKGHREACSGLAFTAPPIGPAGDTAVSVSKEPRLMFHTLSSMETPYQRVPPVAHSWSPFNDLVAISNPSVVASRDHYEAAASVNDPSTPVLTAAGGGSKSSPKPLTLPLSAAYSRSADQLPRISAANLSAPPSPRLPPSPALPPLPTPQLPTRGAPAVPLSNLFAYVLDSSTRSDVVSTTHPHGFVISKFSEATVHQAVERAKLEYAARELLSTTHGAAAEQPDDSTDAGADSMRSSVISASQPCSAPDTPPYLAHTAAFGANASFSLMLPESMVSTASVPALPSSALSSTSLPFATLSASALPPSVVSEGITTNARAPLLPPSILAVSEAAHEGNIAMPEELAQAAATLAGTSMRETERVRFLADGYRVSGAPVGELCKHNSEVAASAGQTQLSEAWLALHYILHDVPVEGAASSMEEKAFEGSTAPGLLPTLLADASDSGEHAATVSAGLAGDESAAGDTQRLLLESITPVFNELLSHHAEIGDAQTCAIVARTLQPIVPDLVPQSLLQRWTRCYIELLHRLQLFSLANDVIKQSNDESISTFNQRSTTISVGGGGASSSQGRPARATCSVCQRSVKGLFVWCQGCGHGGHIDHMRKWFEQSLECPAGCGHNCLVRSPSATGFCGFSSTM